MLSSTRSWKRQLLQIWTKITFFTIQKRLFLYVFSGTRDKEIKFFWYELCKRVCPQHIKTDILRVSALYNFVLSLSVRLLWSFVFFDNFENLRFLRNGCELPGFWIKVAPKFSVMGFGAPENDQNGKIDVFWASVLTVERRMMVIFHRKLKSFKNQLEWY